MTSPERLNAEQLAVRSLLDLIDRASACRDLYERANMALPEPLQRILGLTSNNGDGAISSRVVITAPARSNRPPGVQPDWIWISAADAYPSTFVLAVLRDSAAAIRAKDLVARVQRIRTDISSGTIANMGSRLDGVEIQRTDEGWSLLRPERAAILFDGYLWGPASVFTKFDLAAHRRDGVLHLLSATRGGLQTSQIHEQLGGCSWMKAPVNKELIQADMELLAEAGKVRRRGNSKKWVPNEEG